MSTAERVEEDRDYARWRHDEERQRYVDEQLAAARTMPTFEDARPVEPKWREAPPDALALVLTGPERDAYAAFREAAAALREHATEGQKRQQAYREALERLSAVVAP